MSASPPVRSHAAGAVRFADGFWGEERDGVRPFRWMRRHGRLEIDPEERPRFLELAVLSEFFDLSQTLTLAAGDQRVELPLPHGWSLASVELPPRTTSVELQADPPIGRRYHPADTRELSIRVAPPRLHQDRGRHEAILGQHANAVLNTREMLAGATVLESTPPLLGIDIRGTCTVKPPCVYCEWDAMKKAEGDNVGAPFDVDTVTGWGRFFGGAGELVNCSIGEPFMDPELHRLLDLFAERGKVLEMSTNGQILTPRQIDSLVGRDVHLYVSVDAASAETYARLRNRRFDQVVQNVRALVRAKGGRGPLPWVYLVFMPMRVNRHELDDFIRLCADLEVDRLILRPLNPAPTTDLRWDRGGYRFDYQRELLPFDELVRLSGRAHELCRRYGVPLGNQLDFGGSTAEAMFAELFEAGRREVAGEPEPPPPATPPPDPTADPGPARTDPARADEDFDDGPVTLGRERWPICTEPWRILYIMRRGTLPCCYGEDPVAPMDGFREAWNGALLQEIRAELAAGRFHRYCLASATCPIVRKDEAAGLLDGGMRRFRRLRRAWLMLNHRTKNFPLRLLDRLRSVARSGRDEREREPRRR